ncbi:MAG: Crp/Fnr family transcriptional regulator [Salibacteraceae bacterium]
MKKGEILQKKGDFNTKVYQVQKGLLRSYILDEKGKEHIYMFGPENWLVTDNCKPDEPCTLYIDAIEDTELQLMSKSELLETEPDLNRVLKRLNTMQARILMLMSSSAKDRYEHFIHTYPDITQRVPQRMIASYLGITPEALSRVRKESVR